MTPHWFGTINNYVTFIAALVVAVAGAVGLAVSVYKFLTGGFGFVRTLNKINKFVDRVDVMVDDFWPEILGGLERKGLVNTGATAKWTSAQAKILKASSPIQITDSGKQIIDEIGFGQSFSDNAPYILGLVKEKIKDKTNITDFDIEQASLQVISDLFNNNHALITNAKNYSFNHPQMPIPQLEALMGIFIRDKIIKDPEKRSEFGLKPL